MPDRLRQAREAAGLSQSEVAERLAVSQAAISRWESGRKSPSLSRVQQLAELYRVSLDWLVFGK
ncbi:MAG: helix-turn-helix domain-containing protein [Planctomycetota bacterium]